ncbi:molybdopterin-dependent oxidoreductase [Halarchaeum sp. P4]|uniref:molybdopterin-dependent oxidoreductase n=1 Tax=Halarchaeum sp. P4 TaxID=3421639 RepID=UPI003EBF90E3
MTDLEPHPVPESIDTRTWKLRVTGAVAQPLTLTRDDVRTLPDDARTDDFTCIEGWEARDLSWRGVRVEALLSRATPADDATHVLVHAMDGDYASAFRIERARDALLAFELDGDPLPVEHGGPVRLVPTDDGTDCWESVKWVSRVDVTTGRPNRRATAKDVALSRVSASPD